MNGPASTENLGGTVDYLRSRAHLGTPRVTKLSGGVSGDTTLVEVLAKRMVVKRALCQLLVDGDWQAKPERAMTEAAALRLLHRITPDNTPQLLDADPSRHTIVMTAAPADWPTWKDALLDEAADPSAGPVAVAVELGRVLGTWHDATWGDPAVAARFDDYEALEQLRLAPFHGVVAAAHPAVADRVDELATELRTRRDCLVHGDFSPKNILVGGDGLMVIDFEVAHTGAAVFDLAFLQCHLALKALHVPVRAAEFAAVAAAFLQAYKAVLVTGGRALPERSGWHTACLLLARVDGLSPARYLDAETAAVVRRLSLELLKADDLSPDQLWQGILAEVKA